MSDTAHAALMDSTYRYQRRFYDLTRRYYLLGRDHLIAELDLPRGGSVLEIACGTGRNLALVRRRHPGCAAFGLDISDEMLRSARAKLGTGAVLAQGDACDFDAEELFGRAAFDRVILSYSLSMIPDWQGALDMAARVTAPGGRLHVVDFGGQSGLPAWFRSGLRAWLARFHVTPRAGLDTALAATAREHGATATFRPLYRDYAVYGTLTRG